MEKTTFAGLTRLEPEENISADGGSFQSDNPRVIDRLLEIGVRDHVHDNHARLSDPTAVPSASVVPSAGQIDPDLSIYIGYTLTDGEGGETRPSEQTLVSTQPAYDPPESAPMASAAYTGGSLLADDYYYALTLTDANGGETPPSPWVSVEREPGFASGRIHLWGLRDDFPVASAVAWRLYRSHDGGEFQFLAQGNTDTFTDTGTLPPNCTIHPPGDTENTTNATNSLIVRLPSGASGQALRLYTSLDGVFSDPSFIEELPMASAGRDRVYRRLDLLDGRPPDVSTCVGGARILDPDTELQYVAVKEHVSTYSQLPAGKVGDIRLVADTGILYGVLDGTTSGPTGWKVLGVGTVRLTAIHHEGSGATEMETIAAPSGQIGIGHDGSLDIRLESQGGSGVVHLGLFRRASAVLNISLASGETDTGSPDAMGSGARIHRMAANRPCRVRMYPMEDYALADQSRPFGQAPAEDAGLFMDVILHPGNNNAWTFAPPVHVFSGWHPPNPFYDTLLTNLGSQGNTTVTFEYVRTE